MSLHLPPRPRRRAVAAAAIALWLAPHLAGCRVQAKATPADTSARHAIERVMERYLDAYRRNDPAAIAELYAGDAVLLAPGHDLIQGRDGIREFWAQGMEAGFTMNTVKIEVAGRTGYVVGRYHVPPDENDDAETGKFIVAVRREADGVWRITADIWNADQAGDHEPDSPADSAARSVAGLAGQAFETIVQRP